MRRYINRCLKKESCLIAHHRAIGHIHRTILLADAHQYPMSIGYIKNIVLVNNNVHVMVYLPNVARYTNNFSNNRALRNWGCTKHTAHGIRLVKAVGDAHPQTAKVRNQCVHDICLIVLKQRLYNHFL